MTFKDLIKPSLGKFLLAILLFALDYLASFLYAGFGANPYNTYYFIIDPLKDSYRIIMGNTIPLILELVMWILYFLILYLFSCIIIFIVKKLRSK